MSTRAMSDLSLGSAAKAKNVKSLKAAQQVADSWEDEEIESDAEDTGTGTTTDSQPLSPSLASDSPQIDKSGLAAPPPTPSSPSAQTPWQQPMSPASPPASGGDGRLGMGWGGDEEGGRKRPEKTDAVARRMIASALGVRAPRPTEEQRAYDRAVREKERRRREEEREAERKRKEEVERAKAAIWDD
ncbi:hypothetical protein GGR53DRAFT_463483 [Hypoxylon sp. FL1150]|nr:hypothetical protein GGR53DRAFT_463483 [Hypoxylon sp. FL1150]